MSDNSPASDLQGLRRRFIGLLVVEGILGALAIAFAVAAFAFHRPWGLPAFAVALGLALGAQIRFIWMFRTRQA